MEEALPRVVGSERPYVGRVIGVRRDVVAYADGSEHPLEVVEHRGAYAVIATIGADQIVLVRQYRHPTRRLLWEVPAGTVEPNEDPMEGAARELREETGYRARSLRPLGALFTTPGFCDELMHFFHAYDLQEGPQSLDEDERIAVEAFSIEQAQGLLRDGQIADTKTALALLWMMNERDQLVRVTDDT